MDVHIHHIGTRVPQFAYSQAFARERMMEWVRQPKLQRLVDVIYGRSAIETRYSVIGDFAGNPGEATLFKPRGDGSFESPGTAARNAVYAQTARGLATGLARESVEQCAGINLRDITHIVFASCTGFTNPGTDYHLIRDLGLRDSVERYTLGFMGCYAAFPALRMASQFCRADPEAVVLVLCLELCSLHIQVTDQPDTLVANSLFADGAAAAIVSARTPAADRPHYRLNGFASALVPSGERDMTWDIGDQGFNIVLSSYVPDIIGTNIRTLVGDILGRDGLGFDDIGQWAVHPGGRSILDKIEESLGLPHGSLAASREILRDYGNMSSASILFVLKKLLESGGLGMCSTCAMAFGPGLTVETALLDRCSALR